MLKVESKRLHVIIIYREDTCNNIIENMVQMKVNGKLCKNLN